MREAKEMAMAMARSGFLRNALRGGSRPFASSKRGFASSAQHEDACKSLSRYISNLIMACYESDFNWIQSEIYVIVFDF